MSLAQSVAEQWAEVVCHYQEIHPAHKQMPMTALVKEIAEAGIKHGVWPNTSHFILVVVGNCDVEPRCDDRSLPRLNAEYWHQVDRFKICYWNIENIPYDEKWCELAEVKATLKHLFKRMADGIQP